MTRTRKLIIAFWIFIGCMLVWQFYSYNAGLTRQEEAHPTQEHFFFFKTNAAPVAPAEVRHDGADVEQVAYSVENNVPGTGSFTCHVTLKNVGNAKATGIQILVRPFRGIRLGDENVGHSPLSIIDDNSPLAQIGQSLAFPDLAPGESSTQNAVFLSQPDVSPYVPGGPGNSPKPDIFFQTEKANP